MIGCVGTNLPISRVDKINAKGRLRQNAIDNIGMLFFQLTDRGSNHTLPARQLSFSKTTRNRTENCSCTESRARRKSA